MEKVKRTMKKAEMGDANRKGEKKAEGCKECRSVEKKLNVLIE